MENVKSSTHADEADHEAGFARTWWSRAGRPLWRQQREAVLSDAQRGLWREFWGSLRWLWRAWRDRRPQTLNETWDSVMQRRGYTEADLAVALRAALRAHWSMYLLSGALSVYALWLGLNSGVAQGLLALTPAFGALVSGYCSGYRAWQLQHRRLIRLVDALRIPSTYLVL